MGLSTPKIYALFSGIEVPQLAKSSGGSRFVGDFLNTRINVLGTSVPEAFHQLGRILEESESETNNNQYIRLAKVEQKLKELQDEINCIRRGD